jgi:hypothetical protein
VLVPGAVSAGEPALAVATFKNLSRGTLPNARVTLHFPAGLTVISAPGCGEITPATVNVVCGFGDVASGDSAQVSVVSRLSQHLSQNQGIRVTFALRVGRGTPEPILTGASAKVLASTDPGESRCVPEGAANAHRRFRQPGHLHAVAAGGLRQPEPLPCTPLSGRRQPRLPAPATTQVSSVDLPRLKSRRS